MVLISLTPSTFRSCGLITQSCNVLKSVADIGFGLLGVFSTVYIKISPSPVDTGPIEVEILLGRLGTIP